MIKKVKFTDENVLMASPAFREYVSNFESEINRGISTLCILAIINEYGTEGTYGYQISKDLDDKTQNMLVIEEGTLYPILRKLEEAGIVYSRREEEGRRKKYYIMSEHGKKIYNHISGFFSKLTEAIAPLFDVSVNLKPEKYIFCPECANKIDVRDINTRFCDVCGKNIEKELKERGIEK